MQHIFALIALIALTLSGCGGGSSGGGSSNVKPTSGSQGSYVLPGVKRIPQDAIKVTNAEMAEYYIVAEYGQVEDRHATIVREVARNSYIARGDEPFTLIGTNEIDVTTRASTARLMAQIPATAKIVSASARPREDTFIEIHGTSLPFSVIQAAGNSGKENFFADAVYDPVDDRYYDAVYDPVDDRFERPDGTPFANERNTQLMNIYAAIEANKVLYVAGHDGSDSRHHKSTGCTGVESGCLYAPFNVGGHTGTSGSAPSVASALASVLAVFPDTKGTELIQLAKACAVSAQTLSGLGKADFSCMTMDDGSGGWQLISDSAFSRLNTPVTLRRQVVVPGSASLSASFSRPGKAGTITLGLTKQGTFDTEYSFYAGVPVQIKRPSKDREGFFPITGKHSDSAMSIGGGYQTEQGFFIAGTYGLRDEFFGLGEEYGYGKNMAIDLSVGHPNVFIRVSGQHSGGTNRIIKSAKGVAVGLTAMKDIISTENLQMNVTVNADQFITGSVNTVFGEAKMKQSEWNHEANIDLSYTLNERSVVAISGTRQWHGNGTTDAKIMSTVNIRF